MPKLVSIWTSGSATWTQFIADDGLVGLHCLITQPTPKEVAEAYQGIPMMQRNTNRPPWPPSHFSLESDDAMILAIAEEHGVCIQACPVGDDTPPADLWNTFDA